MPENSAMLYNIMIHHLMMHRHRHRHTHTQTHTDTDTHTQTHRHTHTHTHQFSDELKMHKMSSLLTIQHKNYKSLA